MPLVPATSSADLDQLSIRVEPAQRRLANIQTAAVRREPLADTIYSAIPASWIGRRQKIVVGPLSGSANVRHVLERHGIRTDDSLVAQLLDWARRQDRVVGEDELLRRVRRLTETGVG